MSNKKIFRIARDTTWYPLNLLGKEKNILAFSNDLLIAVGKEEDFRTLMISASSGTLLAGLDNESYDAILSSIPPTVSNQQKYRFSSPYFLLGPVLIVSQRSTETSLKEMEGKVIGVQAGSSIVFDVGEDSSTIFIPYDNPLTALENLSQQRVDGVVLDVLPAYIYTQSFYQDQLRVVTPPLTEEGLRLVTRLDKRGETLVQHFNRGLEAVKDDGTYDMLIKKWGLVNPELPEKGS